ncbi:MAG: thioesterase family protein [Candidatus Rokubacteria bacterium]|nr:thioesterase family protein [Candidatus Rokubacteria bacterium]
MADECLFVPEDGGYQPTEWAVGPWSPDTLQASAYGALLTRLLEADAPTGMLMARLSFDLWRPVTRDRITPGVTVLREGTKARTVEASLAQHDRQVARCTAVFLKTDPASTPPTASRTPPALGPDASRPVPPQVRAWSPFVFWRMPRAPWILLAAETHAGDRGTGVARGVLSDVDGPFGSCEQTLIFEKRR